ncbi:MAG: hypothetical protein JOZ01_07515 [Candidatus Eremiobacteraeota bacterium]|nr:hypothetical protein [Candidatus Eremiobacteraeota bacterium]
MLALIASSSLVTAPGQATPLRGGGSGTCDGVLRVVPAIDVATSYGDFNSLNAVDARTLHDVWAVGQYHRFANNSYDQTLTERWDGTAWSLVPSPNSKHLPVDQLNGVASTGAGDVWAVGYERGIPSGDYFELIEHWTGQAWTVVVDGGDVGYLSSVAASGPNDVWAVGSTNYVGHGLIEHWDGRTWKRTVFAGAEFFRAVSARAPNDVWAVGQLSIPPSSGDDTFAVHFDGRKWTRFATPNPLQRHNIDQNWLTSIAALAANDVWVSGVARDPDYGIFDSTFTLHWNGKAFRLIRSQNPGGTKMNNDLWGIVAFSSDNVWAVGAVGQANFTPLGEHWNDNAWSAATTPSVQGVLMSAAAARADGRLWATGNQIVGSGQTAYTGTLVERACARS